MKILITLISEKSAIEDGAAMGSMEEELLISARYINITVVVSIFHSYR